MRSLKIYCETAIQSNFYKIQSSPKTYPISTIDDEVTFFSYISSTCGANVSPSGCHIRG